MFTRVGVVGLLSRVRRTSIEELVRRLGCRRGGGCEVDRAEVVVAAERMSGDARCCTCGAVNVACVRVKEVELELERGRVRSG